MNNDYIEVKCLEISQPIGVFYLCIIGAKELIEISFADIRRQEGRDIERYIGTQRDLSKKRVNEIKQYVSTIDACFPTSIILSISSEDVQYERNRGLLKIKREEKVAKIIDGQHRIAGLDEFANGIFQLNVTIFIDMDIEDQAMVFATINLKQTKVTKSLAYDLYEYAKSRSPQKTCHNIAKLLNSKESSPFYHRIKILGKASGVETEVITQAAFVDRLLMLISPNPMTDRDRIKRNIPLDQFNGSGSYIFRERFINEKDAEIAKILWNYFKSVERKWPEAWKNFEKGMILSRTTGFAALMKVLPILFQKIGKIFPSLEDFYEIIKRSTISENQFTSENYKPGSSGESDLVKALLSEIDD